MHLTKEAHMSDSTSFPISLPQNSQDDRPLPEIIAEQYGFPLAYHDLDDGKRYYAVQDWIRGVALTNNAKAASDLWTAMKKRLKKIGIETPTWCRSLPYVANDGKTYKRDHADAEALYRITQRMDANTGLRDQILNYLAKSSVVLDDMRRDPEQAAEMLGTMYKDREYQKLRAEGFSHDDAIQWLEQRANGIQTRKWITGVWKKRGAKNCDFALLTNQVSEIVHGKTVTERKHEKGLPKLDTMRNYDAAADQYMTALTEFTSGTLHEWRDSIGFPELSEDVEDTRPLVNAARPHAYAMFSKKPRRLRSGDKPELPE